MKRFFLIALNANFTAILLGFLLQDQIGALMLWGATWAWLIPPLLLTLIFSAASAYLLPQSLLQRTFLPWLSRYSDGGMRGRWLAIIVPWFGLVWAVSNASYFNINGKVGSYNNITDFQEHYNQEKIVELKTYQTDLANVVVKQDHYGKLDSYRTRSYSAIRLTDTTTTEQHVYPIWMIFQETNKLRMPSEEELWAWLLPLWLELPQTTHFFWVDPYSVGDRINATVEILPQKQKLNDMEQDNRITEVLQREVAGQYRGNDMPYFLHPLHFDPIAWRDLSKLLLIGFLVLAQLGIWLAVPKD